MQLDLFTEHSCGFGAVEKPEPAPPLIADPEPGDRPAPTAATVQLPKSLADALAFYEDAASDHSRRVKIRSAFRMVGRVTGLTLDQISADPQQLRATLAAANPALAGLKPRRWSEVKSDATCGLRELGVEIVSRRDTTALNSDWADLRSRLTDRRLQIGLEKFMRFCTRRAVTPQAVTAVTFRDFVEELESHSLHPDPRSIYRQTVKHWNGAARLIAGWPQLVLQPELDPRRYSLPWEAFPKSFVEDVEAFLCTKAFGDELDDNYAPRVRAATTENRRDILRRAASALVLSGEKASDQISSLAVLCQIENVRALLRFLRDRTPEKKVTEHVLNHAWLLRTVARHWVQDEPAAKAITKVISPLDKELAPARLSMRPKNRERLRQFDVGSNLVALYDLPMKTLKRVKKNADPSYRDAVAVMHAVMIGLLTHVPIRSKNLAELETGVHLIDTGKGTGRTLRIHLPEAITKTRRGYVAPIPDHLFPLIDAWLKVYRPRICPTPSKYLFPHPSGVLRSRDSLGAQLPKFVKRQTGLTVHLHLFRHLAAKLILDQDPNAIEVVRQLLGHTSTRVTERSYAELCTDPAFRTLDAVIQERVSRPGTRRGLRPARRLP